MNDVTFSQNYITIPVLDVFTFVKSYFFTHLK